MKKWMKQLAVGVYNTMYYILPLHKNTIIFESSVGRNYTGNPRAIYEELIRQGLDKSYKLVWVLENTNQIIPGKCIKVKRLRLKYFYYMSRAKFWVMDSRQPSFLKKKKGNLYIQTWHGTPLKKLGLDMSFVNMQGDQDITEYVNTFKQNASRWDYLISQNKYSTKVFKKAFHFNKQVLEIGYPRNDVLLKAKEAEVKALKVKFGIPEGKKVVLYAPTWRDYQYDAKGQYKFTMPIDLEAFHKALGEDYILLLKPHYLVAQQIDVSLYSEWVKLYGVNQDIQELYLVSDLLVTDYSSVMFDYSLLKRPMIFFMYDLEEYKAQAREFYFDLLEEAPGQVVQTNEALLEAIKAVETQQVHYVQAYEAFIRKYNALDRGHAASEVVALIKNQI